MGMAERLGNAALEMFLVVLIGFGVGLVLGVWMGHGIWR